MKIAKLTALMFAGVLSLTACSGGKNPQENPDGALMVNAEENRADDEKVFIFGTTAYSVSNADAGLNPHSDYSGWSALRYGVGETLFKYSASMEIEPWLAKEYRLIDGNTWEIQLNEGIAFTSGRILDGQAVKECLEHLIAVHDRAPEDLKIAAISAEGYTVTITTTQPVPAFINYLSDPYGAIIDMSFGVTEDDNVAGTGPFVAVSVSDTEIELVKNENYWNGDVKMDRVIVKSITDGDTLTMALQSGEIDGAQGLPYASLPLFENDGYTISSVATSRAFFYQLNYQTPSLQDENVRKAIAMALDKEAFVEVLLGGNGRPAKGPFPAGFAFGDSLITDYGYNLEEAKNLLAQSGWVDLNGDGYLERDGETLTLRWLTYPSRQELPLLAEYAQGALKEAGIRVEVNTTANHLDFIASGSWDIYASAFVTAPTGDPEYFFTTHALSAASHNRGGYESEILDGLGAQLAAAFEWEKRAALGAMMAQKIVDDGGFGFVSHLQMSPVMKAGVTGFTAHPSDYYEITAELDYIQ